MHSIISAGRQGSWHLPGACSSAAVGTSATSAGHQAARPPSTAAGGDSRLPCRPDVGTGQAGAQTVANSRSILLVCSKRCGRASTVQESHT